MEFGGGMTKDGTRVKQRLDYEGHVTNVRIWTLSQRNRNPLEFLKQETDLTRFVLQKDDSS